MYIAYFINKFLSCPFLKLMKELANPFVSFEIANAKPLAITQMVKMSISKNTI